MVGSYSLKEGISELKRQLEGNAVLSNAQMGVAMPVSSRSKKDMKVTGLEMVEEL